MTGKTDQLTATTVAGWLRAADRILTERRAEIDALNVFPVADADTGTNIAHTVRAATEAATAAAAGDDPAPGIGAVLRAAARAAVTGARGNSGTILSQVFVALSDEAGDSQEMTAAQLVTALGRADRAARGAVAEPREGTVLTVLSAAAAAAAAAEQSLPEVVVAAATAAGEELGRTPELLDVLAAAGVVDAGGLGLVLVLDALVLAVTGEAIDRPHYTRSADAQLGRSGVVIHSMALGRPGVTGLPGLGDEVGDVGAVPECGSDPDHYEVMYLLVGCDERAADRLRDELDAIGDSVVVVADGAGGWSVHVHLTDAGQAIELGLAAGQIRQVQITHLGVQQSRNEAVRPGRVVLAVVHGPEIGELFTEAGARVHRVNGEVSASGLFEAVLGVEAGEVVLLPNGLVRSEDLVAVSAAARPHGRQVLALPSSSMVEGLASIAVHDPRRPANDDTYTMAEAAAATRTARLQIATEHALTWAGTCVPGDALGVIGGEVVVVEPRRQAAAETLIDLMLATGGELVTVVAGRDATDELIDGIEEHLAGRHPAVELAVYPGGQFGDVLQIGVE